MDLDEKIGIVMIFMIFFSISYAVIETASDVKKEVIFDRLNYESKNRAAECSQYYKDGTDNWKECMGVGYQ